VLSPAAASFSFGNQNVASNIHGIKHDCDSPVIQDIPVENGNGTCLVSPAAVAQVTGNTNDVVYMFPENKIDKSALREIVRNRSVVPDPWADSASQIRSTAQPGSSLSHALGVTPDFGGTEYRARRWFLVVAFIGTIRRV